METSPRGSIVPLLLAALAGFVDAVAFVRLGFFATAMGGTTTRAGAGIGAGAPGDAWAGGALVLAFLAGVIAATVIGRARPRQAAAGIMAAVAVLLALGAILAPRVPETATLLPLAAAMGAQATLAGGLIDIARLLVRLGQGLGDALIGTGPRWAWLQPLLMWLCVVAGVVAGARGTLVYGMNAAWIAALAAAALALPLARTREPLTRP